MPESYEPSNEPNFNQAPITRSAFQTDEEYARYLQQLQRSQQQVREMLGPYGADAQARGFNTYDETLEANKRQHQRDIWLKMVLPTLGFAAGGAGLAGLTGGSGVAGGSVAANEATLAGMGAGGSTIGGSVTAPAIGGAVGGGAAGAAGGGFLGMSAKDLAALGLGLGGTIGGAMSRPPNMNPNTSTTDPQLQELIALMSGRLKKSEPLFDSVQSMANGLLPTQYQKGGGGMG